MALHRIKDFDPDYHQHFGDDDVKGLDLYSNNEKVGAVNDVLVDEEGQFRYLVINTGAWIFGKKVLLPIGRARIDYKARRVNVDQLTKVQVESLPEFTDDMVADYDYEEQVRGVYRSSLADDPTSAGVGYAGYGSDTDPLSRNYASAGVGSAGVAGAAAVGGSVSPRQNDVDVNADVDSSRYDRDTYNYDRDPALFNVNEDDHQNLKLYQERLIANKTRQKSGEVSIGKVVETENTQVSVPIERERVVIERVTPTSREAVVPGDLAFQEGEVARMDVYEESADIHKEAFVREEVHVQKVVDREVVTSEEQLRREELDVDADGHPRVDQKI
jgi:uncharacterized protein (TIGR02271 family)